MSRPVPQIIYIAGYGRSGSTVLDLLLGHLSPVVSVGELFMFFRPDELYRCSCGGRLQPPHSDTSPDETECPFWRQVRQTYEQKISSTKRQPVGGTPGLAFRRSIEGFAAPLRSAFWGKPRSLQKSYNLQQKILFEAIAEVSGKTIVVDSSKTALEVAWRPIMLQRATGYPVKVIHLVRDGRAVMWSALRGCNRRLERGETDAALTWPRLRSALGWVQANLSAGLHRWLLPSGSIFYLSYEQLTRHPAKQLTRLGQFLQLDVSPLLAQLSHGHPIPPAHSLSGNRLRHVGLSELREDNAWRSHLSWFSQLLYWLLCWPVHLWLRKSQRLIS